MSQSPPNYMDGVPVKISERYKPPPKVSLPQSIAQRLANSDIVTPSSIAYDFNLEKTVLTKITEWDTVRHQERCDRRARIRRRQEEPLKRIEEKQKQMLTAVSYPSAEDLSSDDDITSETGPSDTFDHQQKEQQKEQQSNVIPKGHFSPLNCFDTILVPTVVPGAHLNNFNGTRINLEVNQNHCTIKHNFNKINYSDFENDTSSPFDNVELKTINDLDILAQVLNLTKLQHSDETATSQQKKNTSAEPSSSTRSSSEEITDDNITNENVPLQIINNIPKSEINSQHLNSNVQYQTPTTYDLTYQPPITNHQSTTYNQFSGNYFTTNLSQINESPPLTQHHQTVTHDYLQILDQTTTSIPSTLSPNYIYSIPQHSTNQNYASPPAYHNHNLTTKLLPEHKILEHLKQQQQQQKSKSVPDILKELNEEVQGSQLKRVRNNSQTNTGYHSDDNSSKYQKKQDQTFHRLSESAQKLAQNISLMGFPLERVSRVAEKFGKDDKKIVEHLIPLSELLDLGFDEMKISEALIKFDNNKEKALDFLIS